MANYDATSGSYTTRLTVTQTSQDVASNTSVLTYSLTLIKNSGYGLWNNDSCPWSITINGTTVSGTFTYDFRNYSSLTLKGNTTISVPHNSDGTKTVTCSASVDMDNSSYVSVMKPSGNLTLTTIPRASTPSVASSYSVTNTTGSLSYSITSQANFYHIVYWGIGDWFNEERVGNINTTTKSFTIPNTSLLVKMPTSTSATLTITVSTYSDSAYNSFVASSTVYSTITVNTSYIKPSVSLGNIVINSTPITGYAVAGYASLRDTFSTTNSSGANGVTTYFSISTGSLQTTSTTSTSGTIYTNTVPQSNSNYTITIYAYAKDSRGAVSDTVSKAFGVWGYQPPRASLSAYRVADSSSTAEDGSGVYVYVTFGGAVTVSIDGQNSIQSAVCTYSGDISGTATNGQHIALGDTQTATFKLTVTDKVTSSTASVTIAKATYPLDLYDNGSGIVGVGLGTTAVPNYLTTPLSLMIDNANSPKGYISLYEDAEGGNIEIGSPNGKFFQIDSNNDQTLRCYSEDNGGNYIEVAFNRTNGEFSSKRFKAVSSTTSGYVTLFGDGEGGNIEVSSPNGKKFQIDAYNDTTLRCYSYDDGGTYRGLNFNRTNGSLSASSFIGSLTGNSTGITLNRTASNPDSALKQNSVVFGEFYDGNIPTGQGYWHIVSLQGPDVRWGTQIAIGQTVQGVFYRRFANNAWTSWIQIG